MNIPVYFRATVSYGALLLAMPRLTVAEFQGSMMLAHRGLRLKQLDGK